MPAPFNTCGTATPITSFPAILTQDVSMAGPDPDSPCPTCAFDCTKRYSAIWYSWTATYSGPVFIDTCSSTYDTLLAVFYGTCGSLLEAACSEDACGDSGFMSQTSFNATEGALYYILITSYNDPGALLVLSISNDAPIPVGPNSICAIFSCGSGNPCEPPNSPDTGCLMNFPPGNSDGSACLVAWCP